MLALKSTRLSQAGAREIDWGNPITRSLFFARVGPFVVYGADPIGVTPNTEASVNQVGNALRLAADGGVHMIPLLAPVTSNSWTLFSVARNGADSGIATIWGVQSDSTQRLHQQFRTWPNSRMGADCRPYKSDYSSATASFTVAEGIIATAFVISGPRNIIELYKQGIRTDSAGMTSTAGITVSNAQFFAKSTNYLDKSPVGSEASVNLAFSRDLSQEEMRSLSLNPWQIFR
jgi:hypothetical protein